MKDTRVLFPICRVFNIYDSSIGDCDVMFLGDCELLVHGISTSFFIDPGLVGLVIFAHVATTRFESKYWDPGLAGVAGVMNRTSSRVCFHWDLGSSDGSKFTIFGADFDAAHHHELYMDPFAS
jgi:hypothetical protein